MKKNKGFTLIELLAIIVILAIIAVITVPIILNIIDNSKRGAVKDSAYGYKDAVNKYYISKLAQDKNYTMPNATYSVTATGTLSDGTNTLEVASSGKTPGSNSWVTIENNKVVSGCLQFDEYKVDITNGILSEATPGTCTSGGSSSSASAIPTCPNCKFTFPSVRSATGSVAYSNYVEIGQSYEEYAESNTVADDYNDVLGEHRDVFLGIVPVTDINGTTGLEEEQIGRIFVCGLYGSEKTPFCIEGTTDGSMHGSNTSTLTGIFPNNACEFYPSDSNNLNCHDTIDGVFISVTNYVDGGVGITYEIDDPDASYICGRGGTNDFKFSCTSVEF